MRKIKTVIKALLLRILDRLLVNDLYMAYHGENLYFVLWDLDQNFFRKHLKHNPDGLSKEQLKIMDEGREYLYDLMEKYEVDFNHVE